MLFSEVSEPCPHSQRPGGILQKLAAWSIARYKWATLFCRHLVTLHAGTVLPVCLYSLVMMAGLSQSSRLFLVFLFLWSVVLTWLVYGRSLTLPFYFDDLLLLPYVAETPLAQLWREPAIFPYFRPLPPTFWRLNYLAWGSHQPVWLHGGNLLLHALNGWLAAFLGVQLLGRRAQMPGFQRRLLALSSATLYLLFPFHFQAVPWVTAVYHLGVTTFILASLTAYLQYRLSGRFGWALLGGLLALAALFTQENGVLILPLVLCLEMFSAGDWRLWRRWRVLAALLPWVIPFMLWFPLWLLAPRTTSELAFNNLETIGQNIVWLLQGMAFPLTWAGGWLRDAWGWNDLRTAVALALAGLGGVALSQWRWRVTPLSGYAWAWCALSGLPTLLLLPFAYLLSSPRLLTVTAVGAAWLWGELLARLLGETWQKRRQAGQAALNGVLAAAFLLLATGPAWAFLQRQMTFHAMLGQAYWQLTAETTAANAAGETAVAINFPAELGVRQPTFALGHEGVVFMAVYIPPDNIVTTQTGVPAQFALLRYDDIRPDTPYIAGVLGAGITWPDLVAQGQPFTVRQTVYQAKSIVLAEAGAWPGAPNPTGAMAEFRVPDPAVSVWLEEARVTAVADSLRVDLTWRIAQPPPYAVTVFVHAVSADGALVSQADGYPWARTYPMGQWPPAAVVGDTRVIPQGKDAVQVNVGLYDSISGQRLIVFASDEILAPDNAVRLTVQAGNRAE